MDECKPLIGGAEELCKPVTTALGSQVRRCKLKR